MNKIHYAGEIVDDIGRMLPGWAACCSGYRAEMIRALGRNSYDRSKVTCKPCLKRIGRHDLWKRNQARIAKNIIDFERALSSMYGPPIHNRGGTERPPRLIHYWTGRGTLCSLDNSTRQKPSHSSDRASVSCEHCLYQIRLNSQRSPASES